MNKVIEKFKKGSGIHIKEKNKGSFTRWCGGNVTSECILRGKNSSNPKIRKKATFADNARHFKHQQGGVIKSLEGSKVNWVAVNAGTNLLSTISKNKLISSDTKAKKAQNQIDYNSFILEATNNAILRMNQAKELWKQSYLNGDTLDRSFESLAVMGHLQHLFMTPELAKGKQALQTANAQAEAEANTLKSNNWGNAFEGIISNGLGSLSTYLGLKKPTNNINTDLNNTSFYKPDSSLEIITTKSGISNTVDDWRKLIGT